MSPPSVHGRTSWTNSVRPSKVSIPERAHPHARIVFEQMAAQGVTYAEIEHRAGVLISTIKAWRCGQNQPSLAALSACLGALGWAYVPVPRVAMLPPRIAAELERLQAEWAGEEPLLHQLLATCCIAPIAVQQARLEAPTIDLKPVSKRVKARAQHPQQTGLFE